MRTMLKGKASVLGSLWQQNQILSQRIDNNNQSVRRKQKELDQLIEKNKEAHEEHIRLIEECKELKQKYQKALHDLYEMQFEYAVKMDDLLSKK